MTITYSEMIGVEYYIVLYIVRHLFNLPKQKFFCRIAFVLHFCLCILCERKKFTLGYYQRYFYQRSLLFFNIIIYSIRGANLHVCSTF